jgi:hypothetical protein
MSAQSPSQRSNSSALRRSSGFFCVSTCRIDRPSPAAYLGSRLRMSAVSAGNSRMISTLPRCACFFNRAASAAALSSVSALRSAKASASTADGFSDAARVSIVR